MFPVHATMGNTNTLCGLTSDGNAMSGVAMQWDGLECGGFFANGDTATIISPGDADLLRVYDEDDINMAGNNANPRFAVDGSGNIRVGGGTGSRGCVMDGDGTVIAGTCFSDARFKQDVTPLGSVLDKLTRLEPKRYRYRSTAFPDKHFGNSEQVGLIAQEVEAVLPELVVKDPDGFRAVRYNNLPMLMLQAIRELKEENDMLKRAVAALEEQMNR
jgi:hypothetical protein